MMNSNFDQKGVGGNSFHFHQGHYFHQNYYDMNMTEEKEEKQKPEVESPPEKLKDVHINLGMGAHPEAIHNRHLPFIGRIRFVRDTAGIIQFSVIVAYWIYGTFSTLFVILLPQYHDSNISVFILACKLYFIKLLNYSLKMHGMWKVAIAYNLTFWTSELHLDV